MDLSTFIVSVFCLIDDRIEDRHSSPMAVPRLPAALRLLCPAKGGHKLHQPAGEVLFGQRGSSKIRSMMSCSRAILLGSSGSGMDSLRNPNCSHRSLPSADNRAAWPSMSSMRRILSTLPF